MPQSRQAGATTDETESERMPIGAMRNHKRQPFGIGVYALSACRKRQFIWPGAAWRGSSFISPNALSYPATFCCNNPRSAFACCGLK